MHQWSRRDFLRLTGGGTVLLAVGGSGLLAACDPTALQGADVNGVRLQPGFTSRIIATTGVSVAGTGYVWHARAGRRCVLPARGRWVVVREQL